MAPRESQAVRQLQRDMESLKAEVGTMRDRTTAKTSALSARVSALERIRQQEFTAAQSQIAEQRRRIAEQEAFIAQRVQQCNYLKQQQVAAAQQQQQQQQQNSRLQSDLVRTRGELTRASQELTALRPRVKALQKDCDELAGAAAGLLLLTALLAHENARLVTENKDLKELTKHNAAELKRLTAANRSAVERCRSLQCEKDTLACINAALVAERDEARRAELQNRAKARSELDAVQARLAQQTHEGEALRSANTALAAYHASEIARKDDEAATLQREMQRTKSSLETAMQAMAALQEDFEGESTELREAVAALEGSVRDQEAEIQELKAQCDALKVENAQLREENEELTGALGIAVVLIAGLGVAVVGLVAAIAGMVLFQYDGSPAAVPRHDPSCTIVVVENERYYPIVGWTKTLLPTDRAKYTAADGTTPMPAPHEYVLHGKYERWTGDWRVENCGSGDGWLYAVDFPAGHYTQNFKTACVRRRIHTRAYAVESTMDESQPRKLLPEPVDIRLRSFHGTRLRMHPSGAVDLQHNAPGAWEDARIATLDDGTQQIFFPAHGRWLSASNGKVCGTPNKPGPHETFRLMAHASRTDLLMIATADGRYLRGEPGKAGARVNLAAVPNDWECWLVEAR
jgi:regulator of replication initiation timing